MDLRDVVLISLQKAHPHKNILGALTLTSQSDNPTSRRTNFQYFHRRSAIKELRFKGFWLICVITVKILVSGRKEWHFLSDFNSTYLLNFTLIFYKCVFVRCKGIGINLYPKIGFIQSLDSLQIEGNLAVLKVQECKVIFRLVGFLTSNLLYFPTCKPVKCLKAKLSKKRRYKLFSRVLLT